MRERKITVRRKRIFEKHLQDEEKSQSTIEKYLRDLEKLEQFLQGEDLNKEKLIAYKQYLQDSGQYKTASINSFLVVANQFCQIMGWCDLRVKTFTQQRETFRPEQKHLSSREYKRLIQAAQKSGKHRLALILQTIGATGVRVSELRYIDAAAVKRGEANLRCKGKQRRILLPRKLQILLKAYMLKHKIKSGPIFCSAKGNPLDRSNIWREMKGICQAAGIDRQKVFPHNLRHLFAVCFYQMERDIVKLADILGHSNVETTRIYTKTTGEEHRRILDRMDMVICTT